MRKAEIRILERKAGLLEETDDGYRFSYDSGYVDNTAIAVNLSNVGELNTFRPRGRNRHRNRFTLP